MTRAGTQAIDTRIIIGMILLAAAIKVYLAASLGLFQDEAYYFLESQRLAASYSDIPPLTAFAIRGGTEVFGTSVLGVRAIFLLAGACLPFLLYWFARPLVGVRDAWLAAACALMVPLLVVGVGSIAVADSLMVPISLVFFGAFERATRTGNTRWWMLAGMALALGFLAHYRFATVALAGIIYLFFTARGRSQLKTSGPWLSAVIGAMGLLPVLWFSFSQEHQALMYQFVERHPWKIDSSSLRFFTSQLLVITPLLFGFLVAAWIRLARHARQGNDRRLLLWLFATIPAGTYFVLVPLMGQSFETFHWPLMGYLPLLVVLPDVLRSARRWLSAATVSLAIFMTLASGALMALQGHTDYLYRNMPGLVFKKNTNFAGWQPMAERAEDWLNRLDDEDLLLVGDHYVAAAQLSFYTGRVAYTTEPWKPARDGRWPQIQLWGLDQEGLSQHTGHDALYVYMASERGRYTPERHQAAMDRMCAMYEKVEHLDRLDLWGANKVFDYYLLKNSGGGPSSDCPPPSPPD